MIDTIGKNRPRLRPGARTYWRLLGWGAAAGLLAVPLIGMQVGAGFAWDGFDFALAAALVVGTGLAFELAVRMTSNAAYRAGVAVALATGFILVWANLAVGIIGSEDNPANLMFFGVLAVGLFGAGIARFRPSGMARAMAATALAHGLVAVIALLGGIFTLFLNGGFVALWLLSALLFRKADEDVS